MNSYLFILLTVTFIMLNGCGGSGSNSSQVASDTGVARTGGSYDLYSSESILCSNETDFEIILNNQATVEVTLDSAQNATYIYVDSQNLGYATVSNCVVVD